MGAAVATLTLLAPTHALAGRAPSPSPRAHLLAHSGHGHAVVEALGSKLPAAATTNRMSETKLRGILERDPSAWIGQDGQLFYVEPAEQLLGPVGTVAGAATASYPESQTFTLHSLPGSAHTIYLDFDGATVSGTWWNTNGGMPSRFYTGFTLDSDATTFTSAEKAYIQTVWRIVAEKYAPFDIDVTTEKPAGSKLTRKDAADQVYGTTVLITNHNGVYDCECGGVAYVGVFDAIGDFYKPALVFWDMLGSGNEKYVAEAISHEAGHNLGLSHDGYSGGGYYPGHGEGETGWAPIMGVGYYKNTVQWSMGEYETANNHEDDFVVVGNNGGPLRVDDHGNSAGSATALTTTPDGPNLKVSGAGVIERRKDKDYFSFTAGAGAVSIDVLPDARSANLDVSLKLLDSTGNVVAKAKPKAVLAATIETTLPAAGTYYLVVDGVGVGNPLDTGYSDYGSLGQYGIKGTVPAP